MPLVIMLFGGVVICEWSTLLFGYWSGVVSLCAWCWMPPILGHGSLITSDVISAVAIVFTSRVFWSFIVRPRLSSAVGSGTLLGLAVCTKFSLFVLYPCWALIMAARILHPVKILNSDVDTTNVRRMRFIFLGIVGFLLSVFVIDLIYLFRNVVLAFTNTNLALLLRSFSISQNSLIALIQSLIFLCQYL